MIVKLDKDREVKLTTGAMRRFKLETGKTFLKVKQLDELEAEELTALVWCCLGKKPDISKEDLEDYIELSTITEIFTGIKAEVKPESDPLVKSGLSSSPITP